MPQSAAGTGQQLQLHLQTRQAPIQERAASTLATCCADGVPVCCAEVLRRRSLKHNASKSLVAHASRRVSGRRDSANPHRANFADVLRLPAVAHVLPLSMHDFEHLAQSCRELSQVYGRAGSVAHHVKDAVLELLRSAAGQRALESNAMRIMGKNNLGIHPRQACLATSFDDLKRRIATGLIQTEFENVLAKARSGTLSIPYFIQERIGHQDGFFKAFREDLVTKILHQDLSISHVAYGVYCRYRRL